VLNQKRAHLRGLEDRFAITITVTADETVRAPQTFVIDRGEQVHTPEAAKAIAERAQAPVAPLEEEDDLEEIGGEASEAEEAESEAEIGLPAAAEPAREGGSRRRRRRRRGRGEHMQDQARLHSEQPHVERIAITESANDAEAPEPFADEPVVETTGGFATEPHEGREEPRRDERRRRRGRRGGRRNRQRNGEGGYAGPDQSGRYSQQDFVPAEQFTAPAATEPELSHAVADLDSPPHAPAAPPDLSPAISPIMSPTMPPAETTQPETSRRRSTVREPVPKSGGETAGSETAANNPAPTASEGPEPVVTETGDASEGERPRRTGWWSRRFAGG
jgi:ribonuclease E